MGSGRRGRGAAEAPEAGPPGGPLVNFCKASSRPHAEVCLTERVGYLEGCSVVPARRREGFGSRPVLAAEAWARARGWTEMDSDAEPDNRVSAAAHAARGFADVGLPRCFRTPLEPGGRPDDH